MRDVPTFVDVIAPQPRGNFRNTSLAETISSLAAIVRVLGNLPIPHYYMTVTTTSGPNKTERTDVAIGAEGEADTRKHHMWLQCASGSTEHT